MQGVEPADKPRSSSGGPYYLVSSSKKPKPSEIYPILWQFATERHRIYLERVAGSSPPWTTDATLEKYKFTNVFRAADRVSQYLIRHVQAAGKQSPEALFLHTMLFKIFNRIDTWEALVERLGFPSDSVLELGDVESVLNDLRRAGKAIYSNAYIMPTGNAGQPKHKMHIRLLAAMLRDELPAKLATTRSLEQVYRHLLAYPSLGPFLAFQYTVDLNYSSLIDHSEMEFVVPGPGALDGISKCFDSLGDLTPTEVIHWVTDSQDREFERLGHSFPGLWGRHLQLVDVQNLFCEISKYTRVTHPKVRGKSGRTQIKQRFSRTGNLEPPFFPPKWGLQESIEAWFAGKYSQ